MTARDEGFSLVMPFVTVASVGGPHDDASYAAGWEMGKLQARLQAARHHGLGLPEVVLLRANLPQVDLIAMDIGAATIEGWPDDHALDDETVATWARVRFDWTEP